MRNKWDLNPDITLAIEANAQKMEIKTMGRIRYDKMITQAQINKLSVVEYSNNGVASDIRNLWFNIANVLKRK